MAQFQSNILGFHLQLPSSVSDPAKACLQSLISVYSNNHPRKFILQLTGIETKLGLKDKKDKRNINIQIITNNFSQVVSFDD